MEKEEKKRRKRAYNRQRYLKIREHLALKRAKERAADPEGFRAIARVYYQAKKASVLVYQAKYRDENREKINAKAREKRRKARESAKEL
jgi:hypothetical protein